MELIDYVRIIRRRWALILVVLIACVAGSYGATVHEVKRYATSTQIIVSGASNLSATDEISQRQLAVQRATSFSEIANTGPAVQAALTYADSHGGPFAALGGPSVSATANGIDPFIDITVKDRDPRRAQAVANAFVVVLPGVINQLEKVQSATPEEFSALSQAGLPTTPYSPKPVRNIVIGVALGLVLGFGGALARDSLDRRLRDSEDVERATGLTVLGVVPSEYKDDHLPMLDYPMSMRAEAYRQVRTNLAFTTSNGTPRSILVTSATSGEGKTSLATNLAIACARTGQRVAIVDADLRRPMVTEYFGLVSDTGLTDIITNKAELREVTMTADDGRVTVLPSGPIPANPSELLGSQKMIEILQALEADHDIVIVDAPPVLPVADALVLSVKVAGVILVTRVGDTTRDRLRRTKEAVAKVNATLVGVVPNSVVQKEDSAYAYAYRYKSRRADPYLVAKKGLRKPQVEEELVADLKPATRRPDITTNGSGNGHGNVEMRHLVDPLTDPLPHDDSGTSLEWLSRPSNR